MNRGAWRPGGEGASALARPRNQKSAGGAWEPARGTRIGFFFSFSFLAFSPQ